MPRILLVEDNDDDAMLFRIALKKIGADYTLDVVSDGASAIKYLSDAQATAKDKEPQIPALILLDLKIPERNGHEVLCWLRQFKEFITVPVIVLTDSNFREDILRASRFGANSYIVKTGEFRKLTQSLPAILHYWLKVNFVGKRN